MLCGLFSLAPARGSCQAVIGARELALGGATTALEGSRWALFGNPAMLEREADSARSPGNYSFSFFTARYFGLPELTDMAATLVLPAFGGTLGAGIFRYGFELYRETEIRAGYAVRAGLFRFGAAASYRHVMLGGGYGSAGAPGIDAGVAAELPGRLRLGAKASNLNRPSLFGNDLPRALAIGLAYASAETTLLAVDVVKDARFPASLRGGAEAELLEQLFARAGVSTAPVTFSFGIGYGSRTWRSNAAVQRHHEPGLGMSPALDFSMLW